MKSIPTDTLSILDILTCMNTFSEAQGRKIIQAINTYHDENKNIYANKIDLQKMENRMLKKIVYILGLTQSMMILLIKLLVF